MSGERLQDHRSSGCWLSTTINPPETNGFSHPYHLDEPIFIFRDIRNDFSFVFHFSMKVVKANRIAPDGTPRFAASRLGLFCLPMSHKKDVRLIWVEQSECLRLLLAALP